MRCSRCDKSIEQQLVLVVDYQTVYCLICLLISSEDMLNDDPDQVGLKEWER